MPDRVLLLLCRRYSLLKIAMDRVSATYPQKPCCSRYETEATDDPDYHRRRPRMGFGVDGIQVTRTVLKAADRIQPPSRRMDEGEAEVDEDQADWQLDNDLDHSPNASDLISAIVWCVRHHVSNSYIL